MEDVVAVVAPLAAPPAPAFSPAAAGLTLIAAAAADPIAAAAVAGAMEGVSVPPVRTASAVEDDALAPEAEEVGEASVAGSPCSVASDCSSVASADFEGVGLGFFAAAEGGGPMVFEDSAASAATVEAEARVAAGGRSVFAVDCVPLWGYTSICGRRPEMEDAVATVPRFFDVPLWMLTGNAAIDGLDPMTFRLPAHFFGVYDGHGGAQVANYCREHLHVALVEQLSRIEGTVCAANLGDVEFKEQWENAFVDCFARVDDEVGGKASRGGGGTGTSDASAAVVPEPVAPETVGSTAVVAVICSSHIIVSNCGDSRAVLCRGKQPVPLSVDHKPNREDEYARIEAEGGKVIQWNGYRVFGVLAMSRSIGMPVQHTALLI
uniref:protein-serine/threonine phosphatase n=1 Tax=Setaria italica TaxID=4555 RepID=K3XIZ8_SETIT